MKVRRTKRVLAALGAGALIAVFAPVLAGAGPADAAPVTVTGTVSGDHAWDPVHNQQYADAPSVTVDQTTELTDQVVHVTWQHFTPSQNNAGSFFSAGSTAYAVTVLQCKGTNPADPPSYSWPDFGTDCYNHTPDDATAGHGVGNEAYTLTGSDGAGETYFHVETSEANDFLGCNATTPCSLVIVPNFGGKQPAGEPLGGSGVDCTKHTSDTSFAKGAYALDNHLGAACSWADRIVVPLTFAPTPDSCPAKDYAFASEGAPMLSRTMQQWQAGWCTGSGGLTFDFDSGTNEYLARDSFLEGSGALSSSTDVAIVNRPADPASAAKRKFTYAPITNSGIAIAYHVDNQHTGQLIDDLTLDARLVAKLITQSYALDFGCLGGGDTSAQGATCDPAVKGNPPDIFDDPEFQALNPQYARTDFPAVSLLNRGQFLPLVLSGNSDLTYELTRWINSDADAHAFLQGATDPYGMHVNDYYKAEPLPLDQFQVLDPGYTAPPSNGTPGMSTMQVTWNPITGMTNVAGSLVIDRPSAINPTLPSCGDAGVPCVYQRFGSLPPGNRAVFAIVGLADAAADRFPVAKLVNAGGAPVGATDAGLSAALADMKTNPDTITRAADYASTDKAQYPLTMTDYAMVPTCGLSAAQASAVRDFLTRVTTSQETGQEPGQLAPGNLQLTATQLAQTRAAAAAVNGSPCPKPSSGHPGSGRGTGPGGTGSSPNDGGSGFGLGGDGTTAGGGTGTGTRSGGTHAGTTSPAADGGGGKARLASFGVKHADSDANPGLILPLALALGALLLLGGPGALLLANTDAGATVLRRVRRGVRR